MAAENGIRCTHVVLFLLFFYVRMVQAEAGEPSETARRLAQQQRTWQGMDADSDQDRWAEKSKRINRLRFEKEGKWRPTDDNEGAGDPSAEEVLAGMERLRIEAERRRKAALLAWEGRAGEIHKKWGKVRRSNPAVYVEYTKNNDAFGGVDYERGFIEVGAVSPAFFHDASRRLERLLSERLSFLLRLETMPGLRDLEGQVRMPGAGRGIRQAEVREFSHFAVRSGEPAETYTAPDGVQRLRKEVRIELVPDHLQARVSQYLPYVQKASRIYEVSPELILAVIQAESSFNPRAVSQAGAVGLMQLMPGSGALEASKLVYGETRLLTREELYMPDKNIELGAAYLRILETRHFRDHRAEPRKLLLLVIAGYNCGPRTVKTALKDRDIRSLSTAELYDLLIRVVPQETQVYLQRVVQNMKNYGPITGSTARPGHRLADFSKPHFAHPLL